MRNVVLVIAPTVLLLLFLFLLFQAVRGFLSLGSSSSSRAFLLLFQYQRPTVSPLVLQQTDSSSSSSSSSSRKSSEDRSLIAETKKYDYSSANTTTAAAAAAMPTKHVLPSQQLSRQLPATGGTTTTTKTKMGAHSKHNNNNKNNTALDYFVRTIHTLQQQQQQLGDEASIGLVETTNDALQQQQQQQQQQHIVSIKSLVFEIIQLEDNNDDDDDDDDDETLTLHKSRRLTDYFLYILAILPSNQRVQVEALEQAVHNYYCTSNTDNDNNDDNNDDDNDDDNTTHTGRCRLQLCPADRLETLCGFAPLTVPPIGHAFPCLTVVEESLLVQNATAAAAAPNCSSIMLQGGGGQLGMSCRLSLPMLLEAQPDSTCVASFGTGINIVTAANTAAATLTPTITETARRALYLPPPKPYFSVEPPNTELVRAILEQQQQQQQQQQSLSFMTVVDTTKIPPRQQLSPVPVTVVGRIARIRRMARRLVFADLVPPDYHHHDSSDSTRDNGIDDDDDDDADPFPWACPGQLESGDMAVQLIAGKTLCETMGEAVLRQLRSGQLVLVQGKTAVTSRDSLQNWVDKKCLDIVVESYEVLRREASPTAAHVWPSTSSVLSRSRHTARTVASDDDDNDDRSMYGYLRMNDLYPVAANKDAVAASRVVLVDCNDSVEQFGQDLSQLLLSLTTAQVKEEDESILQFGLVGIDCEWRPSFYLSSSREQQPVLLLQICLHSMEKVYLFDLQSLLRPLLSPDESPNELETLVSECLSNLMRSTRLIKVGFQLGNDLRRLAASYPNIPAFQNVHSVLEVSALARKVMHMNKQRNVRRATSSLSRLCEAFLERRLNKEQQCSDWAQRPLVAEQIEYASLDAIVTPVLVEKLLHSLRATFFDKPKLGRWADDSKFATLISSSRFFFLDVDTDVDTIRKMNAKRVVGEQFIVTQNWITGEKSPQTPSLPVDGSNGPYTDRRGILRYPSKLVSFTDRKALHVVMDGLVGQLVGRSKDRCVAPFVVGRIPEGSQLDFPPRAGYIETQDIVFLFINMPSFPGRGQPRSYPNEWLEDGRYLTWFMRKNDWSGGTSDIAQKLQNTCKGNDSTVVFLFVRVGKAPFLCCGRCRVDPVDREDFGEGERHTLVKFKLHLLDWQGLHQCQHFRDLVNPEVDDY